MVRCHQREQPATGNSSTGTFVNKDTTSNDTMSSSGPMVLDVMNEANSEELHTNEKELPIYQWRQELGEIELIGG